MPPVATALPSAAYAVVRAPRGGDEVIFPVDDLVLVAGPDGKRRFTHEDGTPY